jgi:hypothetical protein
MPLVNICYNNETMNDVTELSVLIKQCLCHKPVSLLGECHAISMLYALDRGMSQMWPIFDQNPFQSSTIAVHLQQKCCVTSVPTVFIFQIWKHGQQDLCFLFVIWFTVISKIFWDLRLPLSLWPLIWGISAPPLFAYLKSYDKWRDEFHMYFITFNLLSLLIMGRKSVHRSNKYEVWLLNNETDAITYV